MRSAEWSLAIRAFKFIKCVMSKAVKGRLRVPKLTVELRQDRNTKLMLFRNDRSDTPHLTLSWNNPSKSIDVHLKARGPGGTESHREIAVIPERNFLRLIGTFKDKLRDDILVNFSGAARLKPGRLGRWGYAIFYLDEDEKREFIDRIAPLQNRRRPERVLDPNAIVDWANSSERRKNFYHPSALHYIAAVGTENVIMAGRIRGKRKPKLLPLGLFRRADGRPVWLAMDRLSKSMLSFSESFTLSCLKQLLPDDAWAMVFNELHLEEVGFNGDC
jgi:hypothetical protein